MKPSPRDFTSWPLLLDLPAHQQPLGAGRLRVAPVVDPEYQPDLRARCPTLEHVFLLLYDCGCAEHDDDEGSEDGPR